MTVALCCVQGVEAVDMVEWLSSWLAEQGVRGSNPGLAILISKVWYLLLSSRNMTLNDC